MLGRPFQEVLDSGQPDFPFALCWANESWYRRWQGVKLDEMILEQVFSEEDDIAHIRWLIECFKDPRYIRIEGRPLLAVYRPHFLPDPKRTVELWRASATRRAWKPPWLVMFETEDELIDPAVLGFDASAEFVPHHLPQLIGKKPFRFGPEESPPDVRVRRGGIGLSQSPGGGMAALSLRADSLGQLSAATDRGGLDPAQLDPRELRALVGTKRWRRQSRSAGRDGIVFVNAWNEWAEGAHLEPDAFWGRAYLEVTRDVLRERFG